MSLNTADANDAVLLHAGETILIYCKNTIYEFSGNDSPEFQGQKFGHTYLTSHRMAFRNRSQADLLSSLSMPFVAMKNVCLRGDTILGALHPQPNGNFINDVHFKLAFVDGGAIEFIHALMVAACSAIKEAKFPLQIPPYKPSGAWYESLNCDYRKSDENFEWIPRHEAFTTPRPNSVYITDNFPPYPGIRRPFNLHRWQINQMRTNLPEESIHDLYRFSPMDGVFPSEMLRGDDPNSDSVQHKGV